jgi:hypothetical protein
MKASIRTVPIESKKCCLVEVLASEVLVLAMTLCGLYTDDGTDGGCILYISDDPDARSSCKERLVEAR